MQHIVLIGFMATGKSAVGRRMASKLDWDFLDMDSQIEKEQGLAISEIFARGGEREFRRIERETVAGLQLERPTVIATGGGTFVDERNRELLRELGVVVCLVSSVETVLERVGRNDKRPLASGPEGEARVRKLYEERVPAYRTADIMVETDGLTVEQSATRVLTMVGPRLDPRGGVAHTGRGRSAES